MTPEHWKRVTELFEAAVEQETAARAEFLARAAAGDAALAEEVLRLLASDEKAATFLDSSPGLGSLPVGDGHFEARLELLREENPTLARDLKTLLTEHHALGDEGLQKTEIDPHLAELGARESQSPRSGQKVGAYTLESPIGQGGMGTVWVARRSDGRFEGRAAVKFLNVGLLGGAAEERFRREGTILARLSHPHIAHLIDAGVSPDGQPYLILEYVEGRSIERYCSEHVLGVEARLRLFLEVLAAVAHAHANLIVHRDLKPSNVLVTDDGHVKLLDFGIAKLLEDEAAAAAATQLTRQGERALTLAYAAPEQVTGNAITTATDVYALGVLLHLLLTGKHPAQSSLHSPEELAKAIVESPSPRISKVIEPTDKLRRALRGDLEAIVGKALSKNPAERYASVTALAEDLRRYLGHQPISARPNTPAYRAKKFVRRNRLAVALASAAIVAAGAGLVGTILQARRAASAAERERNAAERARIEATTATAVKDFLLGIFNASSKRQADPMRAQAVTARELLDRGAERLLADRTFEPTVLFELLSALVGLYNDLGLYDKVLELGGKQIEAARVAFGSNDPRLASALVDYARAAYHTVKAKDSLSFLEEAERILDSNGDQTSLIRVSTDTLLARYWGVIGGDFTKSRSYARKAVEICRRNHPTNPVFIESLRVAAEREELAHDARASFELYKEAVELHRRLGAPEIDLIKPLEELAGVEAKLSRFADAERHFKEVVALSLRLNGEEHSLSIHTAEWYGYYFLRVVGRLGESEALLRRALQTAVRLLGPEESLYVLNGRYTLADTLRDIGKIEEAELLCRQHMAELEKSRPNTIFHANGLESTALLQLLLGRYELADRMLAQAQSIREHLGQADTAWAALLRAQYELAVGEPSQALSTLATTTFTKENALQRTFSAEVVRTRALVELGRAEEAGRVASASLERFSTTPEAEELKLNKAEVLVAHGLALTRLGRAKEVEVPLREALAWREANMDANSPMVAESLIALAECYLSQGDRAKARPLVERAKRIHRSHPHLGEHLRAPLRKIEQRLAAR